MIELSALFTDVGLNTILILLIFAFVAGFLDAIVGGGGLIQFPALLTQLPSQSLLDLFGTNKIANFFGTSLSAFQYSKRVQFDFKLLILISACALFSSYLGAKAVSQFDLNILKQLLLLVLIGIAIFTYFKKDLGNAITKDLSFKKNVFMEV